VADREADIRELGTPADWLPRSKHNRALPEGGRLWAKVLASPSLGEVRFTLPGGRDRTAREVRQALYAQHLTLADGQRGTFEVTCPIAREIAPPPGVKPIEWRLLTNRTAETLEAGAVDRLVPGPVGDRAAVLGAQGGLPRRGTATREHGTD
jgi:hypothetical protein